MNLRGESFAEILTAILASSVKSSLTTLHHGRWWIALYVIRTLAQLG
jgi:hypothetical protein